MGLSWIAVVVHVFVVFSLVAGVIGRNFVFRRAAQISNLDELRTLIALGHQFEMRMVRPMTFAVLVAGLIAAWVRGWPILGFLQGANVNWVLTALLIYLSIIPVIIFVFVPRGKVFHAALDEAIAQGQVTPRLTAALRDPAVAAARTYELIMIATLTVLMVAKPF